MPLAGDVYSVTRWSTFKGLTLFMARKELEEMVAEGGAKKVQAKRGTKSEYLVYAPALRAHDPFNLSPKSKRVKVSDGKQ